MSQKKKSARRSAKKKKLSVCMIVKNEEKMLPQCLNSIRDVADEIIIVDTGSTDRTMAIAREFGAKVYEHPWQKNFSLHRNQSISYATGDWILQIDADEELSPESQQELQRLVQDSPEEVNGYTVVIRDVHSNGRTGVVFNYPRLFRNGIGVKYEGIVHNQVLIPGQVRISNVVFNHYGYDLDHATMLRKFRRTTSLLKKLTREKPDDPMAYFYLACAYSQYGMPRRTIAYSRKTIDLLREMDDVPQFYLSIYQALITALLRLGKVQEAEEAARESLQIAPDYIDGYYHLTKIYYIQKRFQEAVKQAQAFFRLYKKYLRKPEIMGNVSIYSLYRIASLLYVYGVSLLALGKRKSGLAALRHATASPDGRSELGLEACHNVAIVGGESAARELFQRLYHRNVEDGAFILSLAAELAGMDRLAWLEEWLRAQPPQSVAEDDEFTAALLDWLRGKVSNSYRWTQSSDPDVQLLGELFQTSGKEEGLEEELTRCLIAYNRLQERVKLKDAELVEAVNRCGNTDEGHAHRMAREYLLIRAILGLLRGISEENIEALLQNLTAACSLLQIRIPDELENVEQIRDLMVEICSRAASQMYIDGELATLAAARALFPSDPRLAALAYKRAIDRSAHLGGFSESLRIVLKFYYPRNRTWRRIARTLAEWLGKPERSIVSLGREPAFRK